MFQYDKLVCFVGRHNDGTVRRHHDVTVRRHNDVFRKSSLYCIHSDVTINEFSQRHVVSKTFQ